MKRLILKTILPNKMTFSCKVKTLWIFVRTKKIQAKIQKWTELCIGFDFLQNKIKRNELLPEKNVRSIVIVILENRKSPSTYKFASKYFQIYLNKTIKKKIFRLLKSINMTTPISCLCIHFNFECNNKKYLSKKTFFFRFMWFA